MNPPSATTSLQTSSPAAVLLPSIRVLRLEIRTRWSRPTMIPGPLIANILRGALGITLRRLVCPHEWLDNDCPPCPLYGECAYGQIFMPTPPPDSAQFRLQQDLPRPFIIEPPGLDPEERTTPEGLTFRLVLFGRATDSLPYFISALDRLGHEGLGRDRVPFSILQITACHPAGEELLFTGGSTSVSLPRRAITTEDLLATDWPSLPAPAGDGGGTRQRVLSRMGLVAESTSIDVCDPARPRLRIHFLTPLLLKSGSGLDANGRHITGKEIHERPPFGVLLRRMRDRISALSLFFGEPWRHPDFAALGAQADEVRLVDSRTTWLTRDRRSTRTGQQHEISGLIGQATYEFPSTAAFATLSPLLKLGELLHVGKNAPWGNGAIRCTKIEKRN